MTATNINIEEFIGVLQTLKANGFKLMDLDMLPDEDHPQMNKLVVHPIKSKSDPTYKEGLPAPTNVEIRDPNINRDNNDIFNLQDFFGL